jgi:preprotein translocase subunit SecE
MEAVKKKSDGIDAMADEEKPQKPENARRIPPSYPTPAKSGGGGFSGGGGTGARPAAPNPGHGFFSIYKKGQGHWTRMGTLGGAVLIGVVTGQFLWAERADMNVTDRTAYFIVGIFALIYAGIVFYLLNRPTNVDFLIATDSEMKKVNWTSRKELFGSTRIVILFMFLIAVVLFLYDLLFHTFFWWIGVLKTPPPFFPDKK